VQTSFQVGDFVFFRLHQPPEKLDARLAGPYEVLSQYRNDVTCKDLVTGATRVFHVERLTLFAGTLAAAKELAYRDNAQFLLHKIDLCQGNPSLRSECLFRCHFADGDVVWKPYSKDIAETEAFAEFCLANPPYRLLTRSAALAAKEITRIRRLSIPDYPLWLPGTVDSSPRVPTLTIGTGLHFYLDLRSWSSSWDFDEFYGLQLPDALDLRCPRLYVVDCVYGSFLNTARTRIRVKCPRFDATFDRDTYWVVIWGAVTVFDPLTMVLVDQVLDSAHSIRSRVATQPLP
jgi:hypothetical protein